MAIVIPQEEIDQRLAAHKQLWVDAGIEYGLCLCGCGGKTKISPKHSRRGNLIKGEPCRTIIHHNSRTRFKTEAARQEAHKQPWIDTGIDYGLCLCGCGRKTKLIQNIQNARADMPVGSHRKYLRGHGTGPSKRVVTTGDEILTCSKCKKDLPASHFYLRPNNVALGWCKECYNRKQNSREGGYKGYLDRKAPFRLKKIYGITVEHWITKFEEQEGKCGICKKPFHPDSNVPHVDHCHTTGEVGKLLCKMCNTMLGMAGDNPEILEEGAKYLQTHRIGG